MAQPSFALPNQLRYDKATPSDLGTETELAIVMPYTGSSPITLQAGNFLLSLFQNLEPMHVLIHEQFFMS